MSPRSRLHNAISALALASMLSACAGTGNGNRVARVADYRDKSVDIGLATRALAALNANDPAGAIVLAERAVAKTPKDAGFRALLGNAYFAAGRFMSAEQAFKDSLSLYPDQPQVMLKLALVLIAQGETNDALAFLDFARASLDPADYGLALALAGRPADAIPVLREAAGAIRADARVRQNLALAYALAGDWTNARVVAAQDVSPAEIDERIQGWMQFAGGSKPATQVAALVGITPAAVDPGAPVGLALVKDEPQMAQAEPVPVPAPEPIAAPVPYLAPPPVEMPVPAVAPVKATPAPLLETAAQQKPHVASLTVKLPTPTPEPAIIAAAPTYVPPPMPLQDFPFVEVKRQPKKAKAVAALARAIRTPVHKALLHTGRSNSVVQLGAYGSRQRVAAAWTQITKRHPALRSYEPMVARFDSKRGTVYRLSIKGFSSQKEAVSRCGLLKSRGGACFVRSVAGDQPVRMASR